MSIFSTRTARRHGGGFTLIEMLISIVIFAIVMGLIYTYLLRTKNYMTSTQEELEAFDNAQNAMRMLREDLYRIGEGRDVENDQPSLLKCAPYDIIFVADLDADLIKQTERFGSVVNDVTHGGISDTDFDPVRPFLIQAPTAPGGTNYWGWDRDEAYGSEYIGAEIVRYSLDWNHDGAITADDREDIITLDPDMTHTSNYADFWLWKEWWGVTVNTSGGSGFSNAYSGLQPVAANIRGCVAGDPQFVYPNTEYPAVLFEYWGHFYNTVTANDDPSAMAPNIWDGEPLDLWGDWGGGPPPSSPDVNPSSAPPGAFDGVLNSAEIYYMLTTEPVVRVLFPENMEDTDPTNDDLNGNGISGEFLLSHVIRKIGLTVTTETGSPIQDKPNMKRSLPSGSPPQLYLFRDYEITFQLSPPNLVHAGAPVVIVTPVTPTPIYETPTPVPDTPTVPPGSPTYTPLTSTATPTPINSYTPTPTPHSQFGYNRDEILFGSRNAILAVALDPVNVDPVFLCDGNAKYTYIFPFSPAQDIIDIDSVNFCDPYLHPDPWNDVVFASDTDTVKENLYYMEHLPFAGINGFDNAQLKKTRVGGYGGYIRAISTGNIDAYDGTNLNKMYPEVFVAWFDPAVNNSYIEIVPIAGECEGFLLPTVVAPTIRGEITDIISQDFDNDGYVEVIVCTRPLPLGAPQLLFYDNLEKIAATSSWPAPVFTLSDIISDTVYPVKMETGQFISGNSRFPDVAVLFSDGTVRLLPNTYTAPATWTGFDFENLCDPNMQIDVEISNPFLTLAAFDADYSFTNQHDWLSLISSESLLNVNTFANSSGLAGCNTFTSMPQCSGRLYRDIPLPVSAHPRAVASLRIERAATDYPVLAISSYLDEYAAYSLSLVGKPCELLGSNLEDSCKISLGGFSVFSMTSTKNAETGISPGIPPTPIP